MSIFYMNNHSSWSYDREKSTKNCEQRDNSHENDQKFLISGTKSFQFVKANGWNATSHHYSSSSSQKSEVTVHMLKNYGDQGP